MRKSTLGTPELARAVQDEGTLNFFLGIAGPILHHSQLLSSMSKVKEQTAEADFSVQVGVAACPTRRKCCTLVRYATRRVVLNTTCRTQVTKAPKMEKKDADIIAEGDEEEEED